MLLSLSAMSWSYLKFSLRQEARKNTNSSTSNVTKNTIIKLSKS